MGAEVSELVRDDDADFLAMGGDPMRKRTRGSASASEPLSLEQLIGDQARSRAAFRQIWADCAPSHGTAPRMRVCEVIIKAIRKFENSSEWEAQARRLLAKAFGGSLLPIGFEEAQKLTRQVFLDLRKDYKKAKEDAMSELDRSSRTATPSLGSIASSRAQTPRAVLPRRPSPGPSALPRAVVAAATSAHAVGPKPPVLGASAMDRGPTQASSAASDPVKIFSPRFPRPANAASAMHASRPAPPTRSDLESLHAERCAQAAAAKCRWLQLQQNVEDLRGDGASGERKTQAAAVQFDVHTRHLDEMLLKTTRLRSRLRGLEVPDQVDTPGSTPAAAQIAEQRDGWLSEAGAAWKRLENKRAKVAVAKNGSLDLQRRLQAESLRVVMLASAFETDGQTLEKAIQSNEALLTDMEKDLNAASEIENMEDSVAARMAYVKNEVAESSVSDQISTEVYYQKLRADHKESVVQLARIEAEVRDAGLDVDPSQNDKNNLEAQALLRSQSDVLRIADAELQSAAIQGSNATAVAQARQQNAVDVRETLIRLEAEMADYDGQLLLARMATAIADRTQGCAEEADFDGPREEFRAKLRKEEANLIKAEFIEHTAADSESQVAELVRKAGRSYTNDLEEALSASAASVSAARACATKLRRELFEVRGELDKSEKAKLPQPSPRVGNWLPPVEFQANQLAGNLQRQLGNALAGDAVGSCRIQELRLFQRIGIGGDPPTAPPSPSQRLRFPPWPAESLDDRAVDLTVGFSPPTLPMRAH